MLLGFILAFCISDSNVFAEEREISEEQLNDFILSTGAPNELLERWDYDQKLDLYLKSTNSTIIFDTTEITEFTKDSITGELIETPNDSNIIMPMATIPSKELQVSHDVWTLIDTDQTKYKSVYANYSWNFTKYGGTNGDKIAIAVPSGWSIKANSYKCKEFQSGLPSSGYIEKANCNGKPYDLDF
ncbi:hypothetical protein PVA17_24085 [Lysinibacillus sp. CNPSo 3705]|uniref:hypothetical protein n=1 Tax=Lysinibacillus sp. CNPSo 3705 TaxID=3028148 RepID=UPI002363C95A|nr:hypothetical protein [Lysinibacillus sp. CNPSo 3705]MDD1505801.1 hypothetical protein [Lysinibacillus sp. CNPSo 3705]